MVNEVTTLIVVQTPGHVDSDMNGETVLFSINKGKYYNLGESGGEVWRLMKEPVKVSQMVEKLTAKYEVDPVQCEDELLSFLDQLHHEGLIQMG